MQPGIIPQRMAWIDWMKSIGIYFIVLGHFFSIGAHYVYVFNVPVFFIISGFLCRREDNQRLFWRKLWYNLIVPMLIISTLNFLYGCILAYHHGAFDLKNIVRFVFNVAIGMHAMGVGACWFVYTLVMMKIIYQYVRVNIWHIAFVILFLLGAYVYNQIDISLYFPFHKASNSIVNVCVSYPFFFLGTYLRRYKDVINSHDNKMWLSMVFVLSVLLVYISGHYNGNVWMYICGYGGNIVWFLIGGIAGTLVVYAISKLLSFSSRYISIISTGTILILGFHGYFIGWIKRMVCSGSSYWDYVYAAIIVVLFIPLIIAAERYFPIIVGKLRIKPEKA